MGQEVTRGEGAENVRVFALRTILEVILIGCFDYLCIQFKEKEEKVGHKK